MDCFFLIYDFQHICLLCIKCELKVDLGHALFRCVLRKMKASVFFVVFVTLGVTVKTEDEDEGPVVPPSSCEGM